MRESKQGGGKAVILYFINLKVKQVKVKPVNKNNDFRFSINKSKFKIK